MSTRTHPPRLYKVLTERDRLCFRCPLPDCNRQSRRCLLRKPAAGVVEEFCQGLRHQVYRAEREASR